MYALGRNLEHDPRSLNFPAALAPALKTTSHYHYGPPLDQGHLGSCTGNAMAQLLNTKPLATTSDKRLVESDAVALYSLATQLDEYAAQYPPTDTGSSGLAVAKAAAQMGYITVYRHAFGLQQLLAALVLQPVIVGTNWYDQMFNPSKTGFVTVAGPIVGGHEYLLTGLNVKSETVSALNSWGSGWGLKGRFKIKWADLDRLLSENGDCTVPSRV